MTEAPPRSERSELRLLIEQFLRARFEAKAENLPANDPRRDTLASQFEFETWVADAARRVGQLQLVTHSLKAIHPDAKGTNLYAAPHTLHAHDAVGTHVLGDDFQADVVGNAAALDVYKFLRLEHNGKALIERVLENDAELRAALHEDREQAQTWMQLFAAIIEPGDDFASHGRAKQVYWLVGEDPTVDSDYHLVAPLFPTSLMQRVYETINEDRFGDSAKQARQARREGKFSPTGYHDYPNLAVQKLGGTKPQNISQLNSERGGSAYLLASLPPNWVSKPVKAPLFTESVFPRFGRRREVRWWVSSLRRLLVSEPSRNRETRNKRDEYVQAIIDELVNFGSAYALLEPGWSASPDCRLAEAEALWLDSYREDADFLMLRAQNQWVEEIQHRFANWLNYQLVDALPVGDAEHQFWAAQLAAHLDELREVFAHV